jgi:DNA-directed RNA polymerase subunit beta
VDFNAGILFLSAEQEEDHFLAPGDILLSRSGKLELNDLIPVRYKQEFATAHPEHIDFIAVSPIQMISIATSLIPFLEHDDANRALMGSNMQRQAVPILKNEKPLVGTGLEAQTARDSSSIILAKQSGFVKYVSHDRIVVDTQHDGGKIFNKLKISSYNLENYKRSNQGTCISQKPLVCEHEWVRKGDVLADGSATLNGELALGRNILVAYTPWEGYNFEDAILISNKLVNEQMYTSIHIEKYESRVQHTPLGLEEFTRDLPNVSYSKLSHLGKNGIVLVGTSVKSGDILVGKVTPKSSSDQTPEGRLLRAIFGEKERDVKNTSLKVPSGIEGWVVDVRVFNSNRVQVFLAQKRPIQLGDKVSGRHGNKGIISNILPQQDMPYLQDGTPVDMVLNPLGVPSRMNVGQVLECLLGLAGQHLNESYRITPFDEMYGDETSRKIVYKKLYEAKLKTGKSWLFDPNFPGKTKVIDGRTGETFKQPVTVGYAYILKLVHLVDDKVHARAIGPYSFVTQQPLRGRAKSGGQRLGEMEVWALEGFGAAYTLQELFTVKSDAIEDRKEALNAIVKGQAIPNPGTPESLKVMIRELQSLCLNIGLYTVDQLKQPKKINIFKMK